MIIVAIVGGCDAVHLLLPSHLEGQAVTLKRAQEN